MKNRIKFSHIITSIVLVVSIVVGVFGMGNMTTTADTPGIKTSDLEKIVLDKKVTDSDPSDEIYTLTIDTFVTGDIVVKDTKTVHPADIVMVLDTSGSMSDSLGTSTRLKELKSSAKAFLTKLQATGADHRVSLVKFSYSSYTSIITSSVTGNDSGFISVHNNAKKGVNSNLTDKIDDLYAYGSTRADVGFEKAYSSINGRTTKTYKNEDNVTQNRPVAVVFFTDGFPTNSGSDESNFAEGTELDVANAALVQTDKLKNDFKATIYTVGLSANANIGPDKDYNFTTRYNNKGKLLLEDGPKAMNAWMHFLSSDYGDCGGSMLTPNRTLKTNNGFYKSASDAASLASAFDTISSSIISAVTTVKITKQAVVKDILSNYFELPADAQNVKDIHIYKVACNGYDSTKKKYKFDEANRKDVSTTTSPDYDSNIKVTITDAEMEGGVVKKKSNISVSGFDYADNCVVYDSSSGACSGAKLQIQFDVKLIDGFAGGNNVPTNSPDSGIYLDPNSTEPLKAYPKPSVNVQVIKPGFEFDLEDITIYKGNTVTADQFLTLGDDASGIEYDYVTRNVYYKEGTEWVKAQDDKFSPKKTITYPEKHIKVTFEPKDIPLSGTGNPDAIGTVQTTTESLSKKDFTIYVLEPTVNVKLKDIQRFYGTSYTLGSFETSEKPTVTVDWKEPNNKSNTPSTKTGVVKPFDGDDIKLDYSSTGYSGKIVKTATTVSVTPKFNKQVACLEIASGDKTSDFATNKFTTSCGFGCGADRTDGTYKIHPKTGALTIYSTGGNYGDTHTYKINKDGTYYTTVILSSGGSAKISELPAGTYTVSEIDGWSWRDTATFKDSKSSATLSLTNVEDDITVIHTADSNPLLGSFSSIVSNIFGKTNP